MYKICNVELENPTVVKLKSILNHKQMLSPLLCIHFFNWSLDAAEILVSLKNIEKSLFIEYGLFVA